MGSRRHNTSKVVSRCSKTFSMYKLGCPESPPNVLVCELNLLVENVLLSGDMTDAMSLRRGLRGRIRGVAQYPRRDARSL